MYVRIPKRLISNIWFVSSLQQCARGILSRAGTSYIHISKLAAALDHSQFCHINSHKMLNYNCRRMCTLPYNGQVELTYDLLPIQHLCMWYFVWSCNLWLHVTSVGQWCSQELAQLCLDSLWNPWKKFSHHSLLTRINTVLYNYVFLICVCKVDFGGL